MTTYVKFPPLPHPEAFTSSEGPLYTAQQMRAYAAEMVAAFIESKGDDK